VSIFFDKTLKSIDMFSTPDFNEMKLWLLIKTIYKRLYFKFAPEIKKIKVTVNRKLLAIIVI